MAVKEKGGSGAAPRAGHGRRKGKEERGARFARRREEDNIGKMEWRMINGLEELFIKSLS